MADGHRVLLTFSGKYGDIVWSLQAARAKALAIGGPVDFAVMMTYRQIVPLLEKQPYINNAFAIPGWNEVHANYGAQPRIPPRVPDGYGEVEHLTYDHHPTEPLIWWGVKRLGLPMPEPPIPFLFAPAEPEPMLVSYAFNGGGMGEKQARLARLRATLPEARFENVVSLPFDAAARRIQASKFFFGCRSSNYVIATGLGKHCLTIEPDPGRRQPVFGCPFAKEHMPEPHLHDEFVAVAQQWMKEL